MLCIFLLDYFIIFLFFAVNIFIDIVDRGNRVHGLTMTRLDLLNQYYCSDSISLFNNYCIFAHNQQAR